MYYRRRGRGLPSEDEGYAGDEEYNRYYVSDEDEGEIQVIVPQLPGPSMFFSFLGDVAGIGWYRDFSRRFLFNTPGVTQNMRNICRFMPYLYNLNEGYPATGFVLKERIRAFFNLPQAFVDSFTDNWNIMTVIQCNKTLDLFYVMIVIHNGRLGSELETILHMSPLPGDAPNIMVFEAHNYGNYNNIPWGNFNIDWNNFAMVMDVDWRDDFHQITANGFTDFHRGVQYMLLSLYHTDACQPRGLGRDRVSYLENQPWYNDDLADSLYNHVYREGKSIVKFTTTYHYVLGYFGRQVLVKHIKQHIN